MRQRLGEYYEQDDGLHLVGEERTDEYAEPQQRRFPAIALTVAAMALFAGGLWFAYVQGTHHPVIPSGSDAAKLIRADDHPTKVKPEQPGGMAIPDQNVSLYNDKPGAAAVEKLLPAPEQPLPRPVPPKEAIEPPAAAAAAVAPAPPVTGSRSPAKPVAAAPTPAKAPASAAKPAAAAAPKPAAAPAAPAAQGPVRLQLVGSLRSADAAREEWARLKRDNPDLLGKLTAVAVRSDLGDNGVYYRIQAGSFSDAAAAEKLCADLKRRNLGCLLAR